MSSEQANTSENTTTNFWGMAVLNAVAAIIIFLFLWAAPLFDRFVYDHRIIEGIAAFPGTFLTIAFICATVGQAIEEMKGSQLPRHSRVCYYISVGALIALPGYGITCLVVSAMSFGFALLGVVMGKIIDGFSVFSETRTYLAISDLLASSWDWLSASPLHMGIAIIGFAVAVSVMAYRCVTKAETDRLERQKAHEAAAEESNDNADHGHA